MQVQHAVLRAWVSSLQIALLGQASACQLRAAVAELSRLCLIRLLSPHAFMYACTPHTRTHMHKHLPGSEVYPKPCMQKPKPALSRTTCICTHLELSSEGRPHEQETAPVCDALEVLLPQEGLLLCQHLCSTRFCMLVVSLLDIVFGNISQHGVHTRHARAGLFIQVAGWGQLMPSPFNVTNG